MWRGEALQYDMKRVLGMPRLPAWLEAGPTSAEPLARLWAEVRPFATSPALEEAATELRRQALAWAEARVEPGCDLDLLPRLGYPTVDILWLREAVEAYFAAWPRLLVLCSAWQELAAAGEATKASANSSHLGWHTVSGVALVLQDMQRTLRLPEVPPEWGLLGQLPTYLYHLWPSLRALLREAEADAGTTALSLPESVAGTAGMRLWPTLALQLLLLTVVAVRLGIRTVTYERSQDVLGPGLDAPARAETGHNKRETARGRDPAPCHT